MILMKKLREEKQLSRAELSRRSGMTPGQIGQFESKRFIPYDRQLTKIAIALDYPIDDMGFLMKDEYEIKISECPSCTQNGHPGVVETIEGLDQSKYVKCGLCEGEGWITYERALEIINENYIKIDIENG